MQVVSDGLKYLWSGLQTFFSALKLGFFKVLDSVPGIDMAKEIEATEKEIVEQKAEREELVTKMATRMEENKAKAAADATAEEGKQTTGLMDDLKGLFGPKGEANALAAAKHKEDKRLQNINFRNNKPGKLGGGSAGGGGAGDKDGKDGKPEVKVDYNAGSEALLKQFAQKEGSPLAGADVQKKSIEADAQKKKQEEEAAKKKNEDAAKKKEDEDAAKKKEEEDKSKKPESAETLLAQLNTTMTKLLAHAEQTTKNTYATYDATKGLNKNLYKA
jgi:hypothetical protein